MKSKYNKCRHDSDCCKPVKSVPCVHTNTDCTFVTEDLDCIEAKKGTMLTKVLSNIDEAVCELREKVSGATSYIFRNIGNGAEVFKKVERGIVEYRTIISKDTSIIINEDGDTINLETKALESNSDYLHVGRVAGIDKINFSGVGDVISSDGTVNVTVTNPNQIDLTGVQSLPGDQGEQGEPGIIPHVGDNNNWFIGDTDTGILARGTDGDDGSDGQEGSTPIVDEDTGNWFINGVDTGYTAVGVDGVTPNVGVNGNWEIGGVDTGVPVTGPKGDKGEPGANGDNGIDGDTPIVNDEGNWEIGGVDTGIPATGPQGDPAEIEVTSLDNTVTVDSQEGGKIIDLSVTIPPNMSIKEAECEKGVPTVTVSEDGLSAVAMCLISDSVSIVKEGDSIRVETTPPDMGGVPALIVNNQYSGTEEGTLVRPFRTLAKALLAYKGTGTKFNPEKRGATIVVQTSQTPYSTTEDINYRDIKLVLEPSANITYSGTTWFLDMDSADLKQGGTDSKNAITIDMSTKSSINIRNGSGFRNRGSDAGASEAHTIEIKGGTLDLSGAHSASRVLFDINGNNQDGFSQPSQTHLSIQDCGIKSDQNVIFKVGKGTTTRVNSGQISSSSVSTTLTNEELEPIQLLGGSITATNTNLQPLGNVIGGDEKRDYFITTTGDNNAKIRLEGCNVLYPKPTKSLIYNKDGAGNTAEVISLTMTSTLAVDKLVDSAVAWGGAKVDFSQLSVTDLNGALVDMTNDNKSGVINKVGDFTNARLPKFNKRSDAKNIGNLREGDLYINTADDSSEDLWRIDMVMS